MGGFKIDALDNHGHGVPDIHNAEEQHQLGAVHHKRQRRDQPAEEHTAGIAHKNLGGVEVPDQKAHAGTGGGRRQQRNMDKAQQAARQQVADHRHKGHAGAKTVQPVGQVDGIDQKDNAEKRDGIVQNAQVHRTCHRQQYGGGHQPQSTQPQHKHAGDNDLHNDFLRRGKPQIAVLDDLDKVIQKADQPAAQRQEQHQQNGVQMRCAEHTGFLAGKAQPCRADCHQNAEDKAQPAHGGGAVFLAVPGGTFLPDGLPEMQLVQRGDQKVAGNGGDGKAEQSGGRQHQGNCLFHGGFLQIHKARARLPGSGLFLGIVIIIEALQKCFQPHGVAGLCQQRIAGADGLP